MSTATLILLGGTNVTPSKTAKIQYTSWYQVVGSVDIVDYHSLSP